MMFPLYGAIFSAAGGGGGEPPVDLDESTYNVAGTPTTFTTASQLYRGNIFQMVNDRWLTEVEIGFYSTARISGIFVAEVNTSHEILEVIYDYPHDYSDGNVTTWRLAQPVYLESGKRYTIGVRIYEEGVTFNFRNDTTPTTTDPNGDFTFIGQAYSTTDHPTVGVTLTLDAGVASWVNVTTVNANPYESFMPGGDERSFAYDRDAISTSAYPLKGNIFTVEKDRYLTEITAALNATVQDVRFFVAELDASDVILEVLLDGEAQSGVSGDVVAELSTPIFLEAGKRYAICAARTDASALGLYTDSGAGVTDTYSIFTRVGTVRHSVASPTAGADLTYSTANSWCVDVKTRAPYHEISARYWRIRAIDDMSVDNMSIAEIEMMSTIGGTDQATEGQTIYGSQRNGTGFAASNAFDNTFSSAGAECWSVVNSTMEAGTAWCGQDFGSAFTLRQITLTSRDDDYEFHAPCIFLVEYSDDNSTWYPYWIEGNVGVWGEGETRTFRPGKNTVDPIAAPYWRVHVSGESAASYYAIAEISMASSVGGGDATSSGQEIHGAERSGFEATKAFDNIVSGNNAWGVYRVDHTAADRWVGQDFGSDFDLQELILTARADGFANQNPRCFSVQKSFDGTNWINVWNVVRESSWSSSEARTYHPIPQM